MQALSGKPQLYGKVQNPMRTSGPRFAGPPFRFSLYPHLPEHGVDLEVPYLSPEVGTGRGRELTREVGGAKKGWICCFQPAKEGEELQQPLSMCLGHSLS